MRVSFCKYSFFNLTSSVMIPSIRTLLQKMESARSEEWSKRQFKIVFLTPHDSPDTLVLPYDIVNDSTSGSGRGTAFTRGQRYVSLSRLEKGPKTTSELV